MLLSLLSHENVQKIAKNRQHFFMRQSLVSKCLFCALSVKTVPDLFMGNQKRRCRNLVLSRKCRDLESRRKRVKEDLAVAAPVGRLPVANTA